MDQIVWFKVDDRFHGSPEVQSIPKNIRLAAIGVWCLTGAWSTNHKTLGFVPIHIIDEFCRDGQLKEADALVDSGLWKAVKRGYQFNSWRKIQDGDYRRNIRKSVRETVMQRDGFACVFCSSVSQLSLDHIVRYRDNGPDSVENLRVLCMPCNLERG